MCYVNNTGRMTSLTNKILECLKIVSSAHMNWQLRLLYNSPVTWCFMKNLFIKHQISAYNKIIETILNKERKKFGIPILLNSCNKYASKIHLLIILWNDSLGCPLFMCEDTTIAIILCQKSLILTQGWFTTFPAVLWVHTLTCSVVKIFCII